MRKIGVLLLGMVVVISVCCLALFAQPAAQDEPSVLPGKISLDIKGMDIIDVLKILAMRGNLNIVAGKNVRGKVTLFLKNVEVLDALDIILIANDLAYEKKGGIINVMTEKDYEMLYGERSYDKKIVKIMRLKYAPATEVGKSLNHMKTRIGKIVVDPGSNTIVLIDVPDKIKEMEEAVENMDLPTATKTFVLNYAKAEDLEEKLNDVLSKNIGKLQVDARMNKIVVTDLPQKLDYIGRLIEAFDERDKVVLIEAKIVQVTLNKDIGYGINWDSVFAGIDTISQSDLSINIPGVTAPTTFTYTRAHGATEHGDSIILRLLESLGKTNVLSTPRITVANNQEAKVLVGTREAFVTSTITQSDGTSTSADNVEFVDVGVSLQVTPIINDDGYITMKVKPEVSSAPSSLELTNSDGSIRTSVPIVTTSEAETQLLVKDGTTIIMAGLMEDTRRDNSDKIPLLGDIPILGHFFRSRGLQDKKTELVIFLTPRIIKDSHDQKALADKYVIDHEITAVKAEHRHYDKYPFSLQEDELEKQARRVSTRVVAVPQNLEQYCRYISDKVNRNLQKNKPGRLKKQDVTLSFVLGNDGRLQGKPEILGQMDEQVEALMIKSIEQAVPFYPFPEDYQYAQGTFRLTVKFDDN